MEWFGFYTTQEILYSKKLTLLSYKEFIHKLKELSVDSWDKEKHPTLLQWNKV